MEFEPQINPNVDPCLMFLYGCTLTFSLCLMQISDLVFSGPDDQYFATSSADGVLHLWSKDSLEHLQFQVLEQVISKKLFLAYPFHSHHVFQNRITLVTLLHGIICLPVLNLLNLRAY